MLGEYNPYQNKTCGEILQNITAQNKQQKTTEIFFKKRIYMGKWNSLKIQQAKRTKWNCMIKTDGQKCNKGYNAIGGIATNIARTHLAHRNCINRHKQNSPQRNEIYRNIDSLHIRLKLKKMQARNGNLENARF